MHSNDAAKFKVLMQGVYDFYSKSLGHYSLRVWWQGMQPFDLATVQDALNRHCLNPDTGAFLPKPADVIRMLEGSTQEAALAAWAKVDRAMRAVGPYVSVVFEDALIHRVLYEMGGWIQISQYSEETWPFARNEFVNRYRGYRMRSEAPDYPPVLIGLYEAQNTLVGFSSDPPVLIGNAQAAQRVLAGGTRTPLLSLTRLAPAEAVKLCFSPQKQRSSHMRNETVRPPAATRADLNFDQEKPTDE